MRRFLPPYCLICCLGLAVFGHHFEPLSQVVQPPITFTGILILLSGVMLLASGSRHFIQARTNFHTFLAPDQLVTSGPFGITRNPMYLGFTLILLGTGVLLGSLAGLLPTLLFWLIAHFWYIPFEERLCEEQLGEPYRKYQMQVRRWL